MNKNRYRRAVCSVCTAFFNTKANRQIYCSLQCRLLAETLVKDDCWEWQGHRDDGGYGRLRWAWREIGAHRAAYEVWVGQIPHEMCVCHSCDNPICINPAHLWLGTQLDNIRDRNTKGRTRANPKAGENGRRAKRDLAGRFSRHV